MIQIRTAVLHNGMDSSVKYAEQLAEKIADECEVVDAFTHASLMESLPVRAIPNVMVCLFSEGMEEYQDAADVVKQLEYIKAQPENEPMIFVGEVATEAGITVEKKPSAPSKDGFRWSPVLNSETMTIEWCEVEYAKAKQEV